jgi:hypothetical protein
MRSAKLFYRSPSDFGLGVALRPAAALKPSPSVIHHQQPLPPLWVRDVGL